MRRCPRYFSGLPFLVGSVCHQHDAPNHSTDSSQATHPNASKRFPFSHTPHTLFRSPLTASVPDTTMALVEDCV